MSLYEKTEKEVTMNIPKKSIGWGFGRCNMNCRQCYNSSGNISPEYDLSILKKIADQICPNTDSINIGTGECGFNANTDVLMMYIKEHYPEVKISLTTNGATTMLLGREKTKQIFHDIDFSIDFPSPDRHNDFRNHPLAWEWVMKGLKLCHEENIDSSIVTCVTGLTSDSDILEFIDIAKKYKCSWRVNWFRPTGRGKQDYELKLTAKRAWEVLKIIADNAHIEALSDPLFEAILGIDHTGYNGCACGKDSCRIQPDLEVTPCVFLKGKAWSGGSIQEYGLEQIFESDIFQRFRSRLPSFCEKCDFCKKCMGGCASRAILYRGSANEPDEFCPIVNNLPMEEIQHMKVTIIKGQEKKVHDGYLCTLIARP